MGEELRSDIEWGANGHPIVSYPDISIDAQMALLRDLGLSWYRVDIGSPGQAKRLAAVLEAAKINNIKVLPVITPGFAFDRMEPDELFEKARSLAFNLVSRFKGDIKVWELGNELESYAIIQPCEMQDDGVQYNCDWGPAGGVGVNEYYGPRWKKVSSVLRGLSTGAREADPTIRRAMGTAGWGHIGAFERMRRDGVEWDISVWHMYGDDPEWGFKALSEFGKPIWVTEFNNLGGSSQGEDAQADGLRRSIIRLRELRTKYNVEAAMIYELLDEPYWAPSVEAQMGLVSVIRSPTGAWSLGPKKAAYPVAKSLLAAGDTGERIGMTPSLRENGCDPFRHNTVDTEFHDVVSYAYCLALARPAKSDEALKANNFLRLNRDPNLLILRLLDAPGLGGAPKAAAATNKEYVALAYDWLLGRKADGGGLSSYASDLDDRRMTRADFLAALINSNEFKERHAKLYSLALVPAGNLSCDTSREELEQRSDYLVQLVLGGNGSAADHGLAEKAMASGKDISEVILQLINKTAAFPVPAAEMSDNQFVTMAYFMLLDRAPDGGGLADYTAALQSGRLTREDLVRSFTSSDEFHSKHGCLFN
ncbi:MAG: DUF4214 domain-containing protein [Hyphomicrobium sp.]|nr:DUF4214 domain-containing protein [Hyphomicrobium sp.]